MASSESTLLAGNIGEADVILLQWWGLQKGIQFSRNSCYIDSTLMHLFYVHRSTDQHLVRNSPIYEQLNIIVQKLRQHPHYCEARVVEVLREQLLLHEGFPDKIMFDFMDAEEFMRMLFRIIFQKQFILYDNNRGNFIHQIVNYNLDGRCTISVQDLLAKSMEGQKLRFSCFPDPLLIIKMPVSGGKLVGYTHVIPDLALEIQVEGEQNAVRNYNLIGVMSYRGNHFTSYIRKEVERGSIWMYYNSRGDNGISMVLPCPSLEESLLQVSISPSMFPELVESDLALAHLCSTAFIAFYAPTAEAMAATASQVIGPTNERMTTSFSNQNSNPYKAVATMGARRAVSGNPGRSLRVPYTNPGRGFGVCIANSGHLAGVNLSNSGRSPGAFSANSGHRAGVNLLNPGRSPGACSVNSGHRAGLNLLNPGGSPGACSANSGHRAGVSSANSGRSAGISPSFGIVLQQRTTTTQKVFVETHGKKPEALRGIFASKDNDVLALVLHTFIHRSSPLHTWLQTAASRCNSRDCIQKRDACVLHCVEKMASEYLEKNHMSLAVVADLKNRILAAGVQEDKLHDPLSAWKALLHCCNAPALITSLQPRFKAGNAYQVELSDSRNRVLVKNLENEVKYHAFPREACIEMEKACILTRGRGCKSAIIPTQQINLSNVTLSLHAVLCKGKGEEGSFSLYALDETHTSFLGNQWTKWSYSKYEGGQRLLTNEIIRTPKIAQWDPRNVEIVVHRNETTIMCCSVVWIYRVTRAAGRRGTSTAFRQ